MLIEKIRNRERVWKLRQMQPHFLFAFRFYAYNIPRNKGVITVCLRSTRDSSPGPVDISKLWKSSKSDYQLCMPHGRTKRSAYKAKYIIENHIGINTHCNSSNSHNIDRILPRLNYPYVSMLYFKNTLLGS